MMNDQQKPTAGGLLKVLPVLAIAVLAASGGAWFATRGGDSDVAQGAGNSASAPAASSAETGTADGSRMTEGELSALQATLERSQLLPVDFRTVPDFTLSDVDGNPLTASILDNRWSLAFFGYTHCPDVCPITLSVMKDVVAELEKRDVEPMQVVFMTVDPVRDTAERMKEYVGFFDADFVGITGELNDIHDLTRSLGIVAAFTANDSDPDNYLVDHTASMLLVDPERRVRAKFTAPHEVATIVTDYLTIQAALN